MGRLGDHIAASFLETTEVDDLTRRLPAISAVICTYTMERFKDTCEAVESLREQTLKPHEIIIAVDHNDELFRRLREALPADVKIVRNEGAQGVSITRNTGILAAIGEFIACMDDDARAHPEWPGGARFLGVRDHGMCDITTTRQPGRPCRCFSVNRH
jgi:glycosyltransferase involved in cell wall biosynthesis